MTSAANLPMLVAICGFAIAFVMGAVANKTNFCTMGAVSDVVNMGSWERMRMWFLAIAVAIIGTGLLQYLGFADISKAVATRPSFNWLSYIVGGFVFGVGMTLGSGCGNKTLIRVGAGSLKSLVVMVFLAISGYMTLKGLFGSWRAEWLDPVRLDLTAYAMAGQDIPTILASITGLSHKMLLPVTTVVMGLGLLIFIFKDRSFRESFDHIFGGVVIGLVVVAGWYITANIGYAENPETLENVFFGTNTRAPESLSFIAPISYSLELLMLWTDKSLKVTFGIAAIVGVIAGSAAYALYSKTFRWEGFASVDDTRNHILAGVLMGFGGVCALGCTVGQGISGVSTLALGSFVATASIIAGCVATLKYQYWRLG